MNLNENNLDNDNIIKSNKDREQKIQERKNLYDRISILTIGFFLGIATTLGADFLIKKFKGESSNFLHKEIQTINYQLAPYQEVINSIKTMIDEINKLISKKRLPNEYVININNSISLLLFILESIQNYKNDLSLSNDQYSKIMKEKVNSACDNLQKGYKEVLSVQNRLQSILNILKTDKIISNSDIQPLSKSVDVTYNVFFEDEKHSDGLIISVPKTKFGLFGASIVTGK